MYQDEDMSDVLPYGQEFLNKAYPDFILETKPSEESNASTWLVRLGSIGPYVAHWSFHDLPGCCGVLVSSGAWVDPNFRRKGMGAFLNNLRCYLAHKMGYGILQCTIVAGNIPQVRILTKVGWIKIDEFTNPRTGNRIQTWRKDVS